MAGIVETITSTSQGDTSIQFEQVLERIKQLKEAANGAKKNGELKKAQELLIEAWRLTIRDIETRTL